MCKGVIYMWHVGYRTNKYTSGLLLDGVILVPIIPDLDETHLINFSEDKKLWPIYISIGNILSST